MAVSVAVGLKFVVVAPCNALYGQTNFSTNMCPMYGGHMVFIFDLQIDSRAANSGTRWKNWWFKPRFIELYGQMEQRVLLWNILIMASEEKPGSDENPDPCLEEEIVSLRSQAESLRQELKTCKDELQKLQKQLSQSERVQKTTENYNKDLRQQISELCAEIHERKKKEREKVNVETQTEEYTWTETDYYNYYYGGYYPSGTETAAEVQENVVMETPETSENLEQQHPINETGEAQPEKPNDSTVFPVTEGASEDGNSIADMLRATAEEAMNQTNFVFDETSGMYYDHGSGFYYDSASQLYYDANTAMYYYYDTESGKYQFHSRIEMPTAQPEVEQIPQGKSKGRKKNRKPVKTTERVSCLDVGVQDLSNSLARLRIEQLRRVEGRETRFLKRFITETQMDLGNTFRFVFFNLKTIISIPISSVFAHPQEQAETELAIDKQPENHHKKKKEELNKSQRSHSRSPERHKRSRSRQKKRSKKRRSRRRSESRSDDSRSRRRRENGSHSDDERRRKRRKASKRSHSASGRNRKSGSDEGNGESEPEEGELTESGHEPSPASTASSSSLVQAEQDSPEREVEIETQKLEEAWPPCVRVTVVRSPVLQTGTLFILTADVIATIGREKDLDHAIRIPEAGVSKSHAEVYFDQEQQCYMLVDQGSQNGTVINGNRILQPKVRCEPCPLTHGDEVKMGETVLSFHIHLGTATCDGCEPGQILAHLSRFKREESTGTVLSKEDKEAQRQKELKMMKSSDFEDSKTLKGNRYKDRAENRRQAFGSEGTFQRDDAPASVHVEIGDENKGRQMLEKMGWKRGEGLGKEGAGMKDPIQLHMHKAQSGLGSGAVMSIEDVSLPRNKSTRNWERARERFSEVCHGDSAHLENSQSPKAWVKSQELE
ncbi:hypothetical protein DNTS_024614 [Danionella cerebrum]|uniref:Angiogenic factor with G patch and FHA domains 1 n=1 Tax=Danionella cerebrum TaxID=2873325 RepID=A0A553NHR1_9TELE|nr:hypothetical protein DNTS_024614 [Danionella translucida]